MLERDSDRTQDFDAPTVFDGHSGGSEDGAIPTRVGAYEILALLGRGGMGVVYLALDPALGRKVALKILPDQIARDPSALDRFRREARLLASMNAPNIATIHSLDAADGRHFLTMEWIEGRSLDSMLREGPLGPDAWLAIGRQIAVALEVAHRNGVVHLDLKPSNVMVASGDLVKVLDFGLAMALGVESDASSGEVRTAARRQDAVSGTPGYMSPEQVRGLAVDSASDIWAFGCLLYECITGAAAIRGDTLREKLDATTIGAVDLGSLPPDTAPRIRDLLEGCLRAEREKRIDSFTTVRRALEAEIAIRAIPASAERAETTPNNLPHQLTPFIGRADQKGDLARLLESHRLVTVTGVGGGGKTRLALEVGRDGMPSWPGGVWFAELAPLADPALVARALLDALRLKDDGRRTPEEMLAGHLESTRALILFDNCEHVLGGVARLAATLLARCPEVRILATSREALNIPGERLYSIPPLAVPSEEMPSPAELEKVESVELFLARAGAAQPGFALSEANAAPIAQICRRLDGIPLAIELAAARVRVLPPEEIARRLDDRFRLLGSAQRIGLPHHQTLRALIDWSYEHLTDGERSLFRRLACFQGGWTLDAAEAVCAGDGIEDWEILDYLTRLVEKSLVEVDARGGQETGFARYRMLETIRAYAAERLRQDGAADAIDARYAPYYTTLAEEGDRRLTGPEQGLWLRRMTAEHQNFRRAMEILQSPDAPALDAWRLAGSLGRYWYIRGHWTEARAAYAKLLARPGAARDSGAAAQALNWAGNLAKLQGDYPSARAHLEESLAIRRTLGDPAGIASSLHNLGNIEKDMGRFDAARALYEEGLAFQRQLGNRAGIALTLNSLAILAFLQGDLATALRAHEEGLAIRRELGDRAGIAASLNNMGTVAEALGDSAKATACLEEALEILRDLGDRSGIATSLNNLGRLAAEARDWPRARALYDDGLSMFRKLGDRRGVAGSLNNLAMIALGQEDRQAARGLLAESLEIFLGLEDRASIPSLLRSLAILDAEEGRSERAAVLLGAAEDLRVQVGRAIPADEESRVADAMNALRISLGAEGFEGAWRRGAALSLAELVAAATER